MTHTQKYGSCNADKFRQEQPISISHIINFLIDTHWDIRPHTSHHIYIKTTWFQ